MNIEHASIIPLIGGEAIGSEMAFGKRPKYIISYEAFKPNDSHLLNYYDNEVPYYLIDKGESPKDKRVDVVSSVCPCAGLSQLSTSFSSDNPANDWMIKSTEFVLKEIAPEVLWGENAPLFAGKIGKPVRDRLYKIARDAGYTMTTYRTRSLLHGVPQVRERSFYFFWKGDRTPLLNYFSRDVYPIEQLILDVRANSLQEVISDKTPTHNPYYQFILTEIHPGWSHQEFQRSLAKSVNLLDYVEKHTDYKSLSKWMRDNGYDKEADKCMYRYEKINSGGNIMRREIVVPKGHIHAFVGYMPGSLVHPVEDRHITYREALSIMGMPEDFILLNPKKNLNHVCQNVPVYTARDMASEVLAVLKGERQYINATNVFQYNHQQTHAIWDEDERSTLEKFI